VTEIDFKIVGERLERFREIRGLSRTVVAQRLGIARKDLEDVEAGENLSGRNGSRPCATPLLSILHGSLAQNAGRPLMGGNDVKPWRSARFAAVLALVLALCWLTSARAETSVRTELICIKTEDGVSLTGLLYQPQQAEIRAGVVMVHGYGGNFYTDVMSFLPQSLAARGMAALAINMRDTTSGRSGTVSRRLGWTSPRRWTDMARRGIRPLFLYGHSMGTNRVLYYLAATGDPGSPARSSPGRRATSSSGT